MIKINTNELLKKINTKGKNYYITKKNNININIYLTLTNLEDLINIKNLREIIYIDNLDRILTHKGYKITKEIYLTSPSLPNYLLNPQYIEISKILDKFRIITPPLIDQTFINNNNIKELTLDKLKYSKNCYIEENSLYLNIPQTPLTLTDELGNYTNSLSEISYLNYKLTQNYQAIINIISKTNSPISAQIIQILNHNPNKFKQQQIENIINYPNISLDKLISQTPPNIVRYIFSNKTIDKNIDIDIELALGKTTNSPIYYIETTYAKICSILNKYKNKINYIENYTTLTTEKSYNILNKLNELEKIENQVITNLEPYYILKYIEELSILSNSYLEEEKIIDIESINTQEKLNLIKSIKITLDIALNLIGIIPQEQL